MLELLPVESSSQLPLNEDEVGESPERFAITLAMSQSRQQLHESLEIVQKPKLSLHTTSVAIHPTVYFAMPYLLGLYCSRIRLCALSVKNQLAHREQIPHAKACLNALRISPLAPLGRAQKCQYRRSQGNLVIRIQTMQPLAISQEWVPQSKISCFTFRSQGAQSHWHSLKRRRASISPRV